VYVPGQKRVPRTARVASYPVVEQDSLVWVWIGDPALADPQTIPRARHLDSPGWVTVRGMEPLAARYELLVDNLLDLSHETYLHGGYIGTPEVAQTPITTEVDDAAGVVYVSRRMKDVECPPFYARSTGIDGRIDRWQDIEYHPPCLYLLHARIAPTGVEPAPDGSDPGAFHAEIVYAITPETETTTHDFWMVARDFALDDESGGFHAEIVYAITPETETTTHDFWFVARDFALEDPEVSQFLADSNRTVVLQDVVALDRLAEALRTERAGYQELSINIDTGGLAARRLLARLRDAAASGEPVAAG
jgi:vanillate O-demethylase monooxygenase subunit